MFMEIDTVHLPSYPLPFLSPLSMSSTCISSLLSSLSLDISSNKLVTHSLFLLREKRLAGTLYNSLLFVFALVHTVSFEVKKYISSLSSLSIP